MKAALIGLSAVAAVALVIGAYFFFRAGGGDTPTSYAAQLEKLCTDARKQIEGLGTPSETPMTKLYPGTVRIGRAFVKDAGRLQPPSEQASAAKTFVQGRGLYYDGLAYAYQFLTVQKNQVAFVRIVDGALANLANAETAAKALGAPACALRPFE
jgi:hypothetical protein